MHSAIRDWFAWAGKGWDRFWFTAVSPSLLGIIRLLAGGMIFYTHLVWTKGIDDFYSSTGWMPRRLMVEVQDRLICPSFWWYVPDEWLFPVHYLCLAILAAFMLGLATRITSVLSFAIVVSYAYRTMCANFGLDQINALLALYLCIGPSGQCWSVDAWIRRLRDKKAAPKSVTANISLRLMQIHLCIIYTFAGTAKLGGTTWLNGYAMWWAAANYEYQSWSLLWMAEHEYLFNFLTHVSSAWELSFWALVWHPKLRPIVLAIGVGVHLGIGAFMGMWTFGLAMIIAYFSFLPPEWFVRRARGNSPLPSKVTASSDDWQSRLQSYIETYVTTVAHSKEPAARRMLEPKVIVPSRVTMSPSASRSSTQSAAGGGDLFEVDTDKLSGIDAAENASAPRVLLIEPRVQHGLQLQEALLEEGYRCQVAVDPRWAAQVLAVQECDALVVNATSMTHAQWRDFVSLMGDHPGSELSLIVVLAPWQWEWRNELRGSRVRAIRHPMDPLAVVAAVSQST